MQVPESQIAVTLYNVREFCTTESDLDCTLAKIRAMGYRAIQVSACPLPAETIRKIMDRNDLYCCATHESLEVLSGETKPLAERLAVLGCNFTALGYPGEQDFTSQAAVDQLAVVMNRQGEALAEYGVMLGYHNHQMEFAKIAGTGKTFLRSLMDATAGHNVWSELDVHWVTRGGGSPAAWISALSGRISVIHFKDFTIIDRDKPAYCEIGEGNLDWPEILRVCEATGVRWYSIEQDDPFPGRNIFDSIKISFDNLRAMGVK